MAILLKASSCFRARTDGCAEICIEVPFGKRYILLTDCFSSGLIPSSAWAETLSVSLTWKTLVRIRGSIVTTLLICVGVVPLWNDASAQNIIFVDQTAIGADNGTSWTDAFVFLQDALMAARVDDEVWVVAGLYRPDTGASAVQGDREASFSIPSGVSLYGGFSGIENNLDQRDLINNETILTGDLLANDDSLLSLNNPLRRDNSYHVVSVLDLSNNTTLDGFSITSGMGDDFGFSGGSGVRINSHLPLGQGGQFYLTNCTFSENVARGSTVDVSVSPETDEPLVVISNSTLRNNFGITTAGIRVTTGSTIIKGVVITENLGVDSSALYVTDNDVYVFNSIFYNNTTTGVGVINFASTSFDKTLYMWNNIIADNHGGATGVRVGDGNFVSVNNVFTGNTTARTGAAISINVGNASIINNVFAFNSADGEGSVFDVFRSNVQVSNSIFWENSSLNGSEFFSSDPGKETLRINNTILQSSIPIFATDDGGNFSGNPFFANASGPDNISGTLDDDFRLSIKSPAIDAGINGSLPIDTFDIDGDGNSGEPWPTDFEGNVRVFDGGSGIQTVDIGAHEFDAPPIGTHMDTSPEAISLATGSLVAYPNPARGNFVLDWNLPRTSGSTIDLFDVRGRHVMRIFKGDLVTNQQISVNTSSLAPGVYVIRESVFGVIISVVLMR